jgi:hypothetical protein
VIELSEAGQNFREVSSESEEIMPLGSVAGANVTTSTAVYYTEL